jgi:phosphoglycerol transferase MdoB-like AlkP superfamily enzyme
MYTIGVTACRVFIVVTLVPCGIIMVYTGNSDDVVFNSTVHVMLAYDWLLREGSTMSKETAGSGGIGFLSLLGLAFIVLKLCHVITWSWWWVLAPLWVQAIIAVVLVIIAVLVDHID